MCLEVFLSPSFPRWQGRLTNVPTLMIATKVLMVKKIKTLALWCPTLWHQGVHGWCFVHSRSWLFPTSILTDFQRLSCAVLVQLFFCKKSFLFEHFKLFLICASEIRRDGSKLPCKKDAASSTNRNPRYGHIEERCKILMTLPSQTSPNGPRASTQVMMLWNHLRKKYGVHCNIEAQVRTF